MQLLRQSLMMLGLLAVLTGVAYPLAVTALAQWLWPARANGSLIVVNGRTLGSELIGQHFQDASHFWGRPSATAPYPYNAAASSGSNLGPGNDRLRAAVDERLAALRVVDPGNGEPVPVDLVTASGSGLDPHISPAAAYYQARRVARARRIPEERIRALIEQHIERRLLGFLGEPRVNVLLLNLALDRDRVDQERE
jgi:K+-transporting ATPase ATPase C chain